MPDIMPDMSGATALPEMALRLPEDAVPLDAVRVTVRPGGVNIRTAPSRDAARLGTLREGEQVAAQAVVFSDPLWLQILWNDGTGSTREGWIASDFTDFARSAAYGQVVEAWSDSGPVLAFRKKLVRELLTVRGMDQDKIARVDTLRADALAKFEDVLTRQTVPREVIEFWRGQDRLRLPMPFEVLPVQPAPSLIDTLRIQGFGPSTFAQAQWPVFYSGTRGLHNGLDYIVPEGSPLLAVADGVIVEFRFMADSNERTLALRPFLPDRYRRPDGSRLLSNVIVAYGHLTGDPTSELVRPGEEVRAGQVIGTSGWPIYTEDDGSTQVQRNNAHLHLEVHLITDGERQLGSRQPFNPLLFFAPRLIALQARLADNSPTPPYPAQGHPFGRLGFFTLAAFRYEPPTLVWEHRATREQPWPPGVIALKDLADELRDYAPARFAGD